MITPKLRSMGLFLFFGVRIGGPETEKKETEGHGYQGAR